MQSNSPKIPESSPQVPGKSPQDRHKGMLQQDHPRIHGEKDTVAIKAISQKGSSPHTRGKVTDSSDHTVTRRIIPACTGKSDQLTDTAATL